MVLRAGDLDAELLLLVQLAQESLGRGPRGDHRVLSRQVGDILDAAVLARQQPRPDDEDGVGERDLLLPLEIVRGRAALDVDGAVLHQRNAVLRRHRLPLDVELGQAQLLLQVGGDALRHLGVEADVLAFAEGVRQRAGRAAHAHDHGARVLDLLEGVGLRVRRSGDGQQGGDQKGLLHLSS